MARMSAQPMWLYKKNCARNEVQHPDELQTKMCNGTGCASPTPETNAMVNRIIRGYEFDDLTMSPAGGLMGDDTDLSLSPIPMGVFGSPQRPKQNIVRVDWQLDLSVKTN